MKNSKEHLQAVVKGIKRLEAKQGKNISDIEIAQKAKISKEQLFTYLNGEEEIPENLITNLIDLYGFKKVVMSITTVAPIRFEESKDEDCLN